ncbi:5933_t:CDS:2, partial [Cetraspora pellucida]
MFEHKLEITDKNKFNIDNKCKISLDNDCFDDKSLDDIDIQQPATNNNQFQNISS